MKMPLKSVPSALFAIGCLCCSMPLHGEVRHTTFLSPGTPAEAGAVVDDSGTSVKDGERVAAAGKNWTYRATIPLMTTHCELGFKAKGAPRVTVTNAEGKTVSSHKLAADKSDSVRIAVATDQPLGSEVRFRFDASGGPVAVRNVRLDLTLPDHNGDGLSDTVETMMGVPPGEHANLLPRPKIPHTGFFFAQPYDATMAVPTDVVQMYNGAISPDPNLFSTWSEKGYGVQGFLHSRYPALSGHDDPAEFQTDRNGRPIVVIDVTRNGKRIDLSVGTLTSAIKAEMVKKHGADIKVEAVDHYKIPTQARIEDGKRCTKGALAAGAQAVCFDEPEIWSAEGYSEAFKKEWQAKYGSAWQPPDSSVDARYQSEQLKALLLHRWVESTLEDVKKQNPSVPRMIAMHSPANYYGMKMCVPHYRLVSMPAMQEVIAEVWNDPFEVSYLEYSSFYNLVRRTDKRLWFMMDPWGDSPAMSLEFYRRSYGDNLLSALMFPQIDTFQPLIWPDRLYGHVPKDYEILMNTVVGALSEMWRYPDGKMEAGSRGIATFISDSMAWQRGEPSMSDFDGYEGLTLPLVKKGVPLEVLSLDRAAEAGYLDGIKCLLVSYDYLKPTDASQNRALAEWTRRGGTLLCFGGTDAYNAVAESFWKRAGHDAPLEDLFAQLGLKTGKARVLTGRDKEVVLEAATAGSGFTPTALRVALGPSAEEEKNPGKNSGRPKETAKGKTGRHYPVTLYAPPTGATPLVRVADESVPVAWETRVGKGRVIFAGVAPGCLKTSAEGPAWIRALVKYGYEKTGQAYHEQPYFLAHRGPYTAVRTLDEPYKLAGRYVDLLSPTLAVLDHPVIAPQACAFLTDATQQHGVPHVLAVSGRLRAYYDGADKTSFLVQAPTQTDGVARISMGLNQPKNVKAYTVLGAPLTVKSEADADTMLLRYPNDADGVVVRMEWEPKKGGD